MSVKAMLEKKRAAKIARMQESLAQELRKKEEMRIAGIRENFDYWLETCPNDIPDSFWAIVGKTKPSP